MLRKILCAGFVVAVTVGLVTAEEFRATIKKVDGKNVTINKGTKDTKAEDETLVADENVKVLNGKFNKDTKKLEPGDPIEGGLANSKFKDIGEKGLRATIITDNNKITEIRVQGKKNQ